MLSADIERIVRTVLRDFGLRMSFQRTARVGDDWVIVVISSNGRPINVSVAATSAHDVRRAVMAALGVDG